MGFRASFRLARGGVKHGIDIAIETVGSTPDKFARLLHEDLVTWGKVIKAAGVKGE